MLDPVKGRAADLGQLPAGIVAQHVTFAEYIEAGRALGEFLKPLTPCRSGATEDGQVAVHARKARPTVGIARQNFQYRNL